ncbi:hypothetical protein TeGR_g3460, partial [Tetraparma gracilis]
WIIKFPALVELESERPFFRPFVHAIVELLLSITVNSVKMHMYNKEARVKWMAAKIKDRALRATFADAVADNAQEYSEAERKQINEGLKMEAEIKETAELDAAGQDARALGQLLVHEMEPVRAHKRPQHLELKLYTFVYRTTVLREVADVLPWFPTMMFQVLRNLPSAPRTTQAKLADFTERDAVITGRAMKMLMLSNATPDTAVDQTASDLVISVPTISAGLCPNFLFFKP